MVTNDDGVTSPGIIALADAASSLGSGASSEALDFASVQRGNPEMQRRAQQVIDACCGLGAANPIELIHDVGAGGLANAVPEAIAHSARGARINLRDVPSAEPGMSPLEIWCNEAQERYLLVIRPEALTDFAVLAPDRVVVRVLADRATRKISLQSATQRWVRQFGGARPLFVRLAATGTVRDTLILVDGAKAWALGQSFGQLAKVDYTTLVRIPAEAASSLIAAYAATWDAADPLLES